jgi:hypothetical protein
MPPAAVACYSARVVCQRNGLVRCGQLEWTIETAGPSGAGQSKLLCTLLVCTPWYRVSTERGGYRNIWSVAILAQALLFEIKRFYIYIYIYIYP